MPWNKPKSLKLEAFPAEQLAALAADYPEIRRKVDELRRDGLTQVVLPPAESDNARLLLLRGLARRGELWIRISYAGNLNVWVIAHEDVGDRDEAERSWITVLHRRAMTR